METHVVWNPTEENISTKLHGAYFTFAPNAQKIMDENKCNFIETNRKEYGLVVLPDEFNRISEKFIEGYEKTEEGKKILAEARTKGFNNLIEFHMDIIKNNQVSLRNYLAPRSPGVDPARLASLNASEGEVRSMQLVAKYKGKSSTSAAQKAASVEKLMDQIGPMTY